MIQVDQIKAFAELEGVEVELVNFDGDICYVYGRDDIYNPIADLALNCAARDKYRVSISHGEVFDCGVDGNGSYDIPVCYVTRCGTTIELMNVNADDIPPAVIECILKSEGKWI